MSGTEPVVNSNASPALADELTARFDEVLGDRSLFSLDDFTAVHRVLAEVINRLYQQPDHQQARETANRVFNNVTPQALEEFGELQEVSFNGGQNDNDMLSALKETPDAYLKPKGLLQVLTFNSLALALDEKRSEFMKLAVLLYPNNLLRVREHLDNADDRELLDAAVAGFALQEEAALYLDLVHTTDAGWTDQLGSTPRQVRTARLLEQPHARRIELITALAPDQRQALHDAIDSDELRRAASKDDFIALMKAMFSNTQGRTPESFLQRVCPDGQKVMVSDSLYFGTDIPGGGTVSPEQWQEFFKAEIATRFPLGSTAWEAYGQWMSKDGNLVFERSRVVNFMHEREEKSEQGIGEIQAAYARRFQQEAVLRAWNEKCVSFNLLN